MAKLKFIDLFAGIGGIRLGFESIGAECVFTSEWNSFSQKTYAANFKDETSIVGDITLDTKIEENFVCSEKHRAFYKKEINLRQVTSYPPFTKIIRVLFT